MKLGWVVNSYNSLPRPILSSVAEILSSAFYLVWSMVHAYALQVHLHKAGLNWSKSGPNHLFFIQNQAPHMALAHTIHTKHLQILVPSSIILSFKITLDYILYFLPVSFSVSSSQKIIIIIIIILSLSLKLVQECPYSIIYQISLILLFFSRPFIFIFIFSHLFLIQQLQMINIQKALQIREKWQIFQYLLSSQRKIAQVKIVHFSIIQKQFGKSISSFPFSFPAYTHFPSLLHKMQVIRWLLSNWGLGELKCIYLQTSSGI